MAAHKHFFPIPYIGRGEAGAPARTLIVSRAHPGRGLAFPFPRSDWEQIPPSIQAFILSLVKRIEVLEAKLSENSHNTSRPPSSDSPYRKPRAKTTSAKKKKRK